MDKKQQSQLNMGVILIVIGLALLGQQLRLSSGLDLGRLWPLILVVIGLGRLGTPDEHGRRGRQGYMLLMVGGIMLLHTFHLLRLNDSWPLFIVAGGVALLFGRGGRSCGPKERTHAS